ncbi:MAG: dTDP-4-dehydrorhamnose 3,5-epimerase [Acidobacteriota bacterium]|nr:dTDP-4-dehydrorhamnose 3,5-epimerase [Acidobacteriota bacterium]
MRFTPTPLLGAWLIELDPQADARGELVRTYCERTFAAQGLNTRWPQCNHTRTRSRGMIRGLHFQAAPVSEVKLVRCTAGAIWDVIVDLRTDSATYGHHASFELSAESRRQLYVPAGFAHGFQCLTDGCEVSYMMSESFVPELARGVRWDDPALNIAWPIASPQLSERDRNLPLLPTRTTQ